MYLNIALCLLKNIVVYLTVYYIDIKYLKLVFS